MLVQPTADEGASSKRPSEAQPTHSPPHPKGSGRNQRGQSSSDKSLSGNEGDMTLQSVYDLCISLCIQRGIVCKAEPSVHKDPLFDEITEDTLDYMESEDAQDLRRTSTDGSKVSTDKEKDSTDRTNEGTDDQTEEGRATQTTQTPTSTIFRDDETIAQIDPKDKGKKKIEEEDESESESDGIPEAEKKFKQLASDEEMARKVQEEWEGEEERKRLAEEEATNDALIRNYDDINQDEDFISIWVAEDERLIKKMNEKGIDSSKNESVKEEDKEEEGTKKRKGGHIKMIARKKKRSQSDVDSDEEHKKCLKIVTFESILDSEIMEKKSVIARLNKVSSPDEIRLSCYYRALMGILGHSISHGRYIDGFALILWGDLKIMMETSTERNEQSDFWSGQQDWKIVTWRLYESCRVCILEFEDGVVIHILVEKRYHHSKDLLQRMLDLGLEVERESSIALDLIRFIKQQIDEEWVFNSPCFFGECWLVQDQTVLGKDYSNMLIADSLLKTIWFINAPCYGNEALASPKANELTIPEQTATGKGTSNPFMAGSLPKTIKPT
ncbi:hypothetical protein Tco_0572770 [Tanacetum coccineum]